MELNGKKVGSVLILKRRNEFYGIFLTSCGESYAVVYRFFFARFSILFHIHCNSINWKY